MSQHHPQHTPAPMPHEVNTNSQHHAKTASIGGHRTKISGLNLPSHQAVSLPNNMKNETLIIPSSSQPSFGGFFTIDIKNTGIIVNNAYLQFNYSAVTGTTLTGYFNPSYFHFTRIEVIQGGNTIDTYYGNEQFLKNEILYYDEDRYAINQASGNYASTAQRTLLSSTTNTNTFYIPLKLFLNQSKMHLLNATDAVQLRVYMDTLANIYTVTAGTLTSCTFNSCNIVLDVTHIDQEEHNNRIMDMAKFNHHWVFHTNSYFTATIPAGVSSATLILASIVGNVAGLIFVLRPTNALVLENAFKYTQIASFHLLDSASTSLCGGQPIPASLASNLLNAQWCKSSYNIETSFGTTDNKANFYIWSHSADIVDALEHGRSLGSRKYYGNEQLQLNFTSALASALQLDLYGLIENVCEQGTYSIKKITM